MLCLILLLVSAFDVLKRLTVGGRVCCLLERAVFLVATSAAGRCQISGHERRDVRPVDARPVPSMFAFTV